ncbi:HD-GYP domain-containing protein [Paenibacillus flagellatus]|nr:HD domain-containing phosphohydrolase [Paenibacillus flagellatus]
MRLGKPIFNSEGQILVGYHFQLTQPIITKLQKMGIDYVYIEDPNTDDIVIEEGIKEETRLQLRTTLQSILETVASPSYDSRFGNAQLSRICSKTVYMVMEDLQYDKNDAFMLMNMHAFPTNDYDHHFIQKSMNVCVYATKLGMAEGYYGDDLIAFSLGALLHDVGSLKISREILNKRGLLSPLEYEEVKKHPEYGFKLLKDEPGIPLIAAHCALQHHERINGSGYPYGLKKEEIHPYAQWIGLLETYDSLTHPRAHREALLPHEAIEILYGGAGTLYDIDKVKLFRNKVAIFPLGLSVQLSSGESGIVSKVLPDFKHRPVVRVLKDPYGADLKQPYEIDLARHLNIMIRRVGEAARAN